MADVRMAVVGATGAVGQEMLKVLEERKFPVKSLLCLADPREAGTKVKFAGQDITVEGAAPEKFEGVDIALFAVDAKISEMLAPEAAKRKAVVIDNSSAFRMTDGVPLVVPEVNMEDTAQHKGIIANPNCSTIIMVVAINPIYQAVGLKRVVVSTYQAVSGAGMPAIMELEDQVRRHMNKEEIKPGVFQHQIAFNLIPHIDVWVEKGYSKEEMKMVWETRKIMHIDDLPVSPTAVRVPVFRSHSESINLETAKSTTPAEVTELLRKAPGVVVMDDLPSNTYPMPLFTSDRDEVFVGRIREDISLPEGRGLNLWVVGDQIRKGAATNAIQIAEVVVERNLY
ncbi:MAG: aspartate-semialdehyde dehydrogenase [Candidatus Saccharibacteria bacterium]